MALGLFFVPLWIWLVRSVAYAVPIRFRLNAVGHDVVVDANHLNQVSGALNAVTVITGFMMFFATFKAGELDRRLVLAGFPRAQLLLAKVAALVLVAAVLALYATVLLWLSWSVRQFWPLATSMYAANLVYGGIGIMLGALLRGELEGMFIVIMTSIVDLGLQSPALNPLANQPGLWILPMYGPMQVAIAAAFTDEWPLRHLMFGLAWCLATSAVGLSVFCSRTRTHGRTRQDRLPAIGAVEGT
ncbi:hypothetical protein ACWCPS_39585 [Streptomyces mauvecolor]